MSLMEIRCVLMNNTNVLFTSWNDVFENPTNIKALDCPMNKLIFLPTEIGNLINLEVLNCSQNQLTSLPTEIGNLVNLRKLNCSCNRLTSSPEFIGNLINLTELNFACNFMPGYYRLREFILPDNLGHLVNLEKFNCSNIGLNSLPEWIQNFNNLRELQCSVNQLNSLPEWIGNLENLQHLHLSDNRLTSLPVQLIECRNLTDFRFNNNPIEFIPEILLRRIEQRRNIRNHREIYDDNQNVHLSSIQTSLKRSIFNLLNDRNQISNEELEEMISNSSLNEDVKPFLIQQFQSSEIHSTLHVSFVDVLKKVILRMETHEHKEELYQILGQEMTESFGMCFTGRLTRLVNTLVGFYEDIRIEISSNEQISTVILQIKARHRLGDEEDLTDEVKIEIRRELKQRGYEDSVIEEWISI